MPQHATLLCRSSLFFGLAALSLGVSSGCHGPGGGLFPYTGASQTLHSTTVSPKTMQLIDVRTNEVIFETPIPPGSQLTYDFVKDSGDDPVLTPDLMRWEIMPLGKSTGRLRNTMSVPNAASRKVSWVIRDEYEYQPEPPEYRMRVDRDNSQSDWYGTSPAGSGRATAQDPATTMYDN